VCLMHCRTFLWRAQYQVRTLYSPKVMRKSRNKKLYYIYYTPKWYPLRVRVDAYALADDSSTVHQQGGIRYIYPVDVYQAL